MSDLALRPAPQAEHSDDTSPPKSIAELASQANLKIAWNPELPFKHWLKVGEKARRAGQSLAEAMRYEEAFVELAVAATIVVEKLPTHREYHTVLHGEQRRNLAVNGTDILDSLSMLKGPLVEKHEWWLAQQISTLGVDDRPKANPATASLLTKVEKGRTRHALQAAHTEHAWRAQNTALEHKGAHFDASPDVIPQVAESPVAIPSPEHTSLPLPDTSLLSETIPEKYGLKAVRVPKTVLTRFLEIVKVATQKGEEACGLLLGKQKGTRYVVTTLLVPKQHATVRGCTMDDEELISQFTEERSLMTLGWIHTHPTQPCFMSSDDLHVHAIFQSTLPEAFAMVCAPNSTPTFGIFRLLDPPGLQIILDCEATKPFHPHPDVPLYTDCSLTHVRLRDLTLEVVDLRDT